MALVRPLASLCLGPDLVFSQWYLKGKNILGVSPSLPSTEGSKFIYHHSRKEVHTLLTNGGQGGHLDTEGKSYLGPSALPDHIRHNQMAS